MIGLTFPRPEVGSCVTTANELEMGRQQRQPCSMLGA